MALRPSQFLCLCLDAHALHISNFATVSVLKAPAGDVIAPSSDHLTVQMRSFTLFVGESLVSLTFACYPAISLSC